ncbi:MAG: hypothetical protein CMQ40_03225 [Gammaproteobacteria bacterium]|nr:hypothetical protein [Gammaproteobacteria bacterium]
MRGVGVDFGTSNSAAACYDGKRVYMVGLEGDEPIMPTATHLDRKWQPKTGQEAVTQYIEENRNRMVELTPEVIAKTTMIGSEYQAPAAEADRSNMADVYGKPVIDKGMPGRLFRGIKRLLGSDSLKRLMVFDRPFRLVALITPIFLRIKKSVEHSIDRPLTSIHCGHPVVFEGSDRNTNSIAFSRLSEACSYAGLRNVIFFPEPVAAALSYLYADKSIESGFVLAFDFGGGTMDLSVIEFKKNDFKVRATGGLPLGGDHIDQLIFQEFLSPALGKGEIWSRMRDGKLVENEFPFDEIEEKLLNWTVTYMLNQNQYRANIIDRIEQGGPGAAKFQRLLDLISHNQSYLVFQEIRRAKATLSFQEISLIDIPELDLSLEISRSDLERIIRTMLNQIALEMDSVLSKAGLEDNEIDIVVRTGGSSQIASVKQALSDRFPGKVVEHDPFTSVAAGLAIANYHGFRFEVESG